LEKELSENIRGIIPGAHSKPGIVPIPFARMQNLIIHGTLDRVLRGFDLSIETKVPLE
jgi:hypothetical protein